MSKSVLGRGLGDLLDAKQNSAAPASVSATADGQVAADRGVYISPGVKTILQGGNPPNTTPPTAARTQPLTGYLPLVRALLVIGDILLLAVCGLLVWRAEGTLTFVEGLGCVAALIFGAILTCASFLLGQEKSQQGKLPPKS
jgi:hypothetical protein